MSKSFLLGMLAIASLASACAQRPDAIAPADISSVAFSGSGCKSIKTKLYATEIKLEQLSVAQTAEANKDAAWVAGGALLFLPAMLVATAGPDHSAEIATLKGQKNALMAEMISSGC